MWRVIEKIDILLCCDELSSMQNEGRQADLSYLKNVSYFIKPKTNMSVTVSYFSDCWADVLIME